MITAIGRYFQINPNIVGIITDDDLTTITTTDYLLDEADNIEALNSGEFEWLDTDIVLISYDGGIGFFTRDAANNTFDAMPSAPGTLSNTLQDGDILVGSALNVATGVTPTGDVIPDNTGLFTIQAGAVDLAMLSSGITPSHVVKFADQETTVGGAAAEAFTVTGAAATDLAFVQIVDNGTNNVTVLQAVVTLNTLTVTFSADPGADCVFNYQLLRAAV